MDILIFFRVVAPFRVRITDCLPSAAGPFEFLRLIRRRLQCRFTWISLDVERFWPVCCARAYINHRVIRARLGFIHTFRTANVRLGAHTLCVERWPNILCFTFGRRVHRTLNWHAINCFLLARSAKATMGSDECALCLAPIQYRRMTSVPK